ASLVREAQLHFSRMNDYINLMRIDLQRQYRKRLPPAHDKRLIRDFDAFCNDGAFYVPAIDKIIFIVHVPARDNPLSDKTGDCNAVRLRRIYFTTLEAISLP